MTAIIEAIICQPENTTGLSVVNRSLSISRQRAFISETQSKDTTGIVLEW